MLLIKRDAQINMNLRVSDQAYPKNRRRLAKDSDEKPAGLFSYEVECSALVEDGRRDRIFPQSLTRMVDVDLFG